MKKKSSAAMAMADATAASGNPRRKAIASTASREMIPVVSAPTWVTYPKNVIRANSGIVAAARSVLLMASLPVSPESDYTPGVNKKE
jgi:hypothetical protein